MKKHILYISIISFLCIGLSSCRTKSTSYNFKQIVKASIKLGIDLEVDDNHTLYIEAAGWLGTPYRRGGISKRGVDCSGLTSEIYRKVYNKDLSRSAIQQREKDCKTVTRRNLKEGDLVFFSGEKSKKRVSHVGIYLKENKFIHASTSKGVIISSLNESYYKRYWLSGGRVK